MRPIKSILILATLAPGPLFVSLVPSSGKGIGPSSPPLTFSKDEQTITIGDKGRNWIMKRPVVSSWRYKPTGRTYWVTPGGDDHHVGTSANPLKSIGKAISMVAPGDIVYVRSGTYFESVVINKSGEEGKPIILSCAPGDLGNVKITPSKQSVVRNPSGAVVTVQTAQHVWINGLVIEGPKGRPEAPTSEHFSANGITWSNGAGYGCRATNNVVYNNVHCGLKELAHDGSNILMEGNVIFNNGSTGSNLDHGIYCPANNCTMDGNIIFNNAGWGMAIYSSPVGSQIYQNISFDNGHGELTLSGTGGRIYNNTLVGSGTSIIYYSKSVNRVPCDNNTFENNICANFNVDTQAGDATGNFDDYNDYIRGGTPSGLGVTSGTHEISADPLFLNAALGDFRLAKGSPCIGSGTYVGLPGQGRMPNRGAF